MSWDNINKTLTDPISFADVADAVGYTGTTHDLGSLISTGNINPFAVNKPYRSSSLQTDPRLTTQFSMLGLQVPYATTVQAFLNYHAAGQGDLGSITPANGWQYLRPRGKTTYNEWYRIFDFLKMSSVGVFDHNAIGYHATAPNPFGSFSGPQEASVMGGKIQALQNLPKLPRTYTDGQYVEEGRPDYDMVISDLNGLIYGSSSTNPYYPGFLNEKLWYYGILLVPMTSSDTWDTSLAAKLVASIEKIDANASSSTGKITQRGAETLEVNYNLSYPTFQAVRYKVYPFLTPSQFDTTTRRIDVAYGDRSSTSVLGGVKLVPIPGAEPTYVTFYSDEIIVEVFADTGTGGIGGVYQVPIRIKITNKTANSISLPASNRNDRYALNLRFRTDSHNYTYATSPGTPTAGEAFYSNSYRWDNTTGTGGVSDATYASILNGMAGDTIQPGDANAYYFPGPDTWTFVNVMQGQAIHFGFYLTNSGWHSGSVVPRLPAVPSLGDLSGNQL